MGFLFSAFLWLKMVKNYKKWIYIGMSEIFWLET